jgi:AcrR family transcriptional regulator
VPRKTAQATTKTGNGGGRSANAARKRDQEVLEAAGRIFYERGYADTSVQDIADELGILKGSLYHYIDSKEDLLFRLLDGTHNDVSNILTEIEAQAGLGPLEALELYVRRQVEYNLDHLQSVAVYYHDFDKLGEERRAKIVVRRREHQRWVADRVREAQKQGLADASLDPVIASHCIFATLIGTYRWYRPRRDRRGAVVDNTTAFAMRAVRG